MKENKIAVIYARFSAEDNEDNGGARSIENQIELLTQYATKNDLAVVKTYTDIGKTGTNMNRPGLIELFEDMEKGLFNAIIVKDLSRFSRNYIEAGTYLDEIFPNHNIRFISVLDNYDSAISKEDESIVLKNFLNAMYSKDIKKKIHKSLKRRVNTSDLIGVIKYGFKRDSNGALIVDCYAAEIIKRIYQEAIEGKAPIKIARGLEQDQVLIPSAYKKEVLGINPNKIVDESKKYHWDASVIRSILRDYEYCGHAVNLSTKKQSKVFDDKNVIVKNIRPAIIDEETFNKAPKIIKEVKQSKPGYLPKLIYCKACNKLMLYDYREKTKKSAYYCSKCHIKVDGESLKEVLYKEAMDIYQQAIYSPEEFINKFTKQYQKNNKKLELELKLKKVQKEIQNLFEKFTKGLVAHDTYLEQLNNLNKQYQSIESELKTCFQPINIELLKSRYYEFVNEINKKITSKNDICKIFQKVYIVKNSVINITYIFSDIEIINYCL